MIPLSRQDQWLCVASDVRARIKELLEKAPLRKRTPGKVGDHSSAFVPRDEKSLVDRSVPLDDNERQISEMQNRISALEVLLATGQNQDVGAIRAEIQSLKLQLSVRTSPARRMDRIGRVT
jgi:hypothetical protein